MTVLIKRDEESSPKFGKLPEKRSFDELLDKGAIVVDKDAGPTSHEEVDFVKRILGIERAGHSGTLDPQVSGVLVVGLGRATRLMEYMLKSNKEYVCLMYLHKSVSLDKIKDALGKFTGKIMQTPPIVSAVKREEREREIYSIDLLDVKDGGQNVLFRVSCEHGTYIRKLCSDIGDYLGVGGQMIELRRTKAGPMSESDNIVCLDKLRNLHELYLESKGVDRKIFEKELRKYVVPMERLLTDFKKVYVRDNAVNSLSHGSDLALPGVAKLDEGIEIGEEIALMTLKGELIAMGVAFLSSDDAMKKNKGAFVKTYKVFMEPNLYPREWKFDEK